MSPRLRPALALSALALAVACAGETDEGQSQVFVIATSGYGVASGTPLAVDGRWLAFLADEAASGGQDLNGDSDVLDQVAVVVDLLSKDETCLEVACQEVLWMDEELYLVCDEVQNGVDLGGAVGATDLVLLHWSPPADALPPAHVADLDRGSPRPAVSTGDLLFLASTEAPVLGGESSLRVVEPSFPETVRPVMTQDLGATLRPGLIGSDEGLVFAVLDETVEGRDLNGDTDTSDTHVLALLDGTGDASSSGYEYLLRSTGLAVADADTPLRASSTGANDWLVGLLVDEASQGENLNVFDGTVLPPSWQASPCVALGQDADQLDQVLFAVDFAAWDLNPLVTPPVNTGIAGVDRVLVVGDAVATIQREADENDCPLNGDGDALDRVLRWMRIDTGNANGSNEGPLRATSSLLALDADLPGPARAVAELDGVLVVQVDEAADGRDHDGVPGTDRDLIAWARPQAGSSAFLFDHSAVGQDPSYATATWMAEQPGRTRLGVAYAESSNGDILNGDGDTLDSMPTWADLVGSPSRLSFPGLGNACVADNAGITLANGYGFYRFDEAANSLGDANGNGTTDDILLLRVGLTSGSFSNMGALNTLARPGVETEADGIGTGAAYLLDETILGFDLNGDADATDLVPRYFQLP
jgi:hypothetical protein